VEPISETGRIIYSFALHVIGVWILEIIVKMGMNLHNRILIGPNKVGVYVEFVKKKGRKDGSTFNKIQGLAS
jgi:hypothetical protein